MFVDLRAEHAVLMRPVDTLVPAPRPVTYLVETPLDAPLSVIEPRPCEPFPWGDSLPERYLN